MVIDDLDYRGNLIRKYTKLQNYKGYCAVKYCAIRYCAVKYCAVKYCAGEYCAIR